MPNGKIIVYSALFGAVDETICETFSDYDRDRYQFVLFTDQHRLRSDLWDIRIVHDLPLPDNKAKSAYYYKWKSHELFDNDIVVWMDSSASSVSFHGLDAMVNDFVKNHATFLHIEKHPGRNSLVDELRANVMLNKDNIQIMESHVQSMFNDGYKEDFTIMVETGFSIRRNTDPRYKLFADTLWNNMKDPHHTKRDQLVFDYALWKSNLTSEVSLFSFEDKCKVVYFQDHAFASEHKEKVLLVGPWLGESNYEPAWVEYITDYLSMSCVDKVIVGCKAESQHLYESVKPDLFIDVQTPTDARIYHSYVNMTVPRFDITSDKEIIPLRPEFRTYESYIKSERKLNVFVNYYQTNSEQRNREIDYCLNALINSREVTNVYVLTEVEKESTDRVVYRFSTDRPTYQTFFTWADSITGDDDVNVIINTDCFIPDAHWKRIKSFIAPYEFWAINRLEVDSIEPFEYHLAVDPKGSQDVWCYVGKVKAGNYDFNLGTPACDHRIAHASYEAGYVTRNVSVDIDVFHYHITNNRSYTLCNKLGGSYLFLSSRSIFENDLGHIMIEGTIGSDAHRCNIITHMGLGDMLICNGIVNTYANKCEHNIIQIFCKKEYYDTVSFMYRDTSNVSVVPVDSVDNIRFDVSKYITQEDRNIVTGAIVVGMETLNKIGKRFDEAFYIQAEVEFGAKWDAFDVTRDLERERAFKESLNLPENYIFVHDDMNRGYNINIYGDDIVRPDFSLTTNIFDWLSVIEGADAIHCIDSSFANLIEILNIGKNRHLHLHARWHDSWGQLSLRNEWTIHD